MAIRRRPRFIRAQGAHLVFRSPVQQVAFGPRRTKPAKVGGEGLWGPSRATLLGGRDRAARQSRASGCLGISRAAGPALALFHVPLAESYAGAATYSSCGSARAERSVGLGPSGWRGSRIVVVAGLACPLRVSRRRWLSRSERRNVLARHVGEQGVAAHRRIISRSANGHLLRSAALTLPPCHGG